MGVYTTSKRPLKSKICIKQKHRNLLKLRYLRIFEVFLNSFYRVLHAERNKEELSHPFTQSNFNRYDNSIAKKETYEITKIIKSGCCGVISLYPVEDGILF